MKGTRKKKGGGGEQGGKIYYDEVFNRRINLIKIRIIAW